MLDKNWEIAAQNEGDGTVVTAFMFASARFFHRVLHFGLRCQGKTAKKQTPPDFYPRKRNSEMLRSGIGCSVGQ